MMIAWHAPVDVSKSRAFTAQFAWPRRLTVPSETFKSVARVNLIIPEWETPRTCEEEMRDLIGGDS